MATIVHEPPKLTNNNGVPPSSGGGGLGLPTTGARTRLDDSSPASRTGVWVGMAAIVMTFAAFSSAMIVRQGSAFDWQHFTLPSVLYVDTAALLASSLALEMARKKVSAFVRGAKAERPSAQLYLWMTLGLGLLFVTGQYMAWLKLRSEGLYLATTPSSSFFYLFTVLHALHVLGGLAGLTTVIWRFSKPLPTLRISTLSAVSYYWHFMDVLWIYLLLLLWMRI
jgi:cytochrome c oxidase subunit III